MSNLADDCASGRLLLLLEGGYDLAALAESVTTSVAHLREPQRFDTTEGELTSWGRLTRRAMASYWPHALAP